MGVVLTLIIIDIFPSLLLTSNHNYIFILLQILKSNKFKEVRDDIARVSYMLD
jgi:hypothetical protein